MTAYAGAKTFSVTVARLLCTAAVIGAVGEGHRAEEVVCRCVAERTVRCQRE